MSSKQVKVSIFNGFTRSDHELLIKNMRIPVSVAYHMIDDTENSRDKTLNNILSNMINVTKSEVGAIYICQKDILKVLMIRENRQTPVDYLKLPFFTENIIDTSQLYFLPFKNCMTMISNDISKDPLSKSQKTSDFNNMCGVPLLYNNKCIGQILLTNKDENYTLDNIRKVYPYVDILSKLAFCALNQTSLDVKGNINEKNEVSLAKDHFLATLSHEIRTPLHGIVGILEIFHKAGQLNDKQKKYLNLLTECSLQLMNQLNNILDFNKMVSGRFIIQNKPFYLKDTIENSVSVIEGKVISKNLKLKLEIDGGLPKKIFGDAERLSQVLRNILNNAVKFTEEGSITLRVSGVKKDPYKNRGLGNKVRNFAFRWKITFEIEDTGIGIPNEDQNKIFQRFEQSSVLDSYTSHTGTGLGLAISKELVKLMGGTITVKSSGIRGKGSKFIFDIMTHEHYDIESLRKKHQKFFSGKNILVVDDKEENRLILSTLIFEWKSTPITVSSAVEALQYLKQDMKFAVAIIDIHMPHMSGVELAQSIREDYPNLPLIAISSVGLDIAGKELFDFYLTKPIEHVKIFPAVLECLKRSSTKLVSLKNMKFRGNNSLKTVKIGGFPGKNPLKTQRQKKTKEKLQILIVEDVENNAFLAKEMLLSIGYKDANIHFAENGQECVSKVKSTHYDVVVMDIIMPIMDGIEATKILKSMKKSPYIIVLSASVQNSDKNQCQELGIDGYLTKPLTISSLEAVMNRFVRE